MSKPLRVTKILAVTDDTLVGTSVPEAEHATYDPDTTYPLAERVILAHKVYESVQADNVGKSPASEPDWWAEVGPTNRWRMFDLRSNTTTTVGAADYYEFAPGVVISSVALISISGLTSVRVRMTDPHYGLVYDESTSLSSPPSKSSWYAWFFGHRTRVNRVVISDLPAYPNAVLRIDVTSSGTGTIGALIYGKQRSIGMGVQKGVRLGIQDFSKKVRNQWGDLELRKGSSIRLISLPLMIENDELDSTYDFFEELAGELCLFIGSDYLRSLTLMAIYTNFDIHISYANYSDCSIDLEGST